MDVSTPIAIVALTRGGSRLGVRLQASLPGATLHLPERFIAEVGPAAGRLAYHNLAGRVGELFRGCRGVVFIMATGIVVRLIAPHLGNKRSDPAVVVMDEAGRYAISLLSGHWGGANALAGRLAALTGGQAVVTTASDVRQTLAVELLARELGCELQDPCQVKGVNAALVNGEPVAVYATSQRERLAEICRSMEGLQFCESWEAMGRTPASAYLILTHRERLELVPPSGATVCLLRPRNLVAGVGCRRGTPVEEIEAAVWAGLEEAGCSRLSLRNLATLQAKADEEGLQEFARRHGLSIEYYSPEELNGLRGRILHPSETVKKWMGVEGVCEPAAMLSAQSEELILPKRKQGRVTLALAEARFTSSGSAPGIPGN
ncbi:MAG: cobalt-precorrin 5A hydrolase [Candidatus Tectomicrobia bacterium]|uniref:Cobalt-precorrin 5A hydrolase n=1 Tax=Tectimicrobiota bacterium TaxID=2528274 RepID=A0A932CL94_UNCTE|nr:cobalt-precorrin 5A hydrolase [Candidatus Tectomicrobia bacterium]